MKLNYRKQLKEKTNTKNTHENRKKKKTNETKQSTRKSTQKIRTQAPFPRRKVSDLAKSSSLEKRKGAWVPPPQVANYTSFVLLCLLLRRQSARTKQV